MRLPFARDVPDVCDFRLPRQLIIDEGVYNKWIKSPRMKIFHVVTGPAIHGASGFFNYAQRCVVSGRLVAVMADCDHQLG